MLCAGQEMIVYGRMKPYGKKLSIVHPDFEIIREGDEQSIHLNRIVPVYGGRMGIAGPQAAGNRMGDAVQAFPGLRNRRCMNLCRTLRAKRH